MTEDRTPSSTGQARTGNRNATGNPGNPMPTRIDYLRRNVARNHTYRSLQHGWAGEPTRPTLSGYALVAVGDGDQADKPYHIYRAADVDHVGPPLATFSDVDDAENRIAFWAARHPIV